MESATIIGGGLAGCEAAYQALKRGLNVKLYEMRPVKMTPAHKTDHLAELVCSNSLRAANIENAVGLLKEEMRRMDSLIMKAADAARVPAGGALAVDRNLFSAFIEDELSKFDNLEIIREEVEHIPETGIVLIASGPLTDGSLAEEIKVLTGNDDLYFYDAVAPIVSGDSINLDIAFFASRYGKGTADYLNCPMTEEEYDRFYNALMKAEVYEGHTFEKIKYFEGCMPIEAMAYRGRETMTFGPLKPVGLENPNSDKKPYAVVQLRKEDSPGTRYNLVGFQTHLKQGEQKRVFRMIPGLENAEFERYGMIHRNTYICSPKVLDETLAVRNRKDLFFAGQITGVEGYIESAAMGLLAGINLARCAQGKPYLQMPHETAIGALANHVANGSATKFEPSNVSFGLFPPLGQKIRPKKAKNAALAQRALNALSEIDLT